MRECPSTGGRMRAPKGRGGACASATRALRLVLDQTASNHPQSSGKYLPIADVEWGCVTRMEISLQDVLSWLIVETFGTGELTIGRSGIKHPKFPHHFFEISVTNAEGLHLMWKTPCPSSFPEGDTHELGIERGRESPRKVHNCNTGAPSEKCPDTARLRSRW